jgi:DinB superfamily
MDLSYPVGKFAGKLDATTAVDPDRLLQDIGLIAVTPEKFRSAAAGLDDRQLDTPYRPDGWTVRQVVHHVADSHMNAYIRFRLAMTEDSPVIKPYDQAKWAELHDAKTLPVEVSLGLLDGLHERWVALLRSFSGGDFARTLRHPELGVLRLDQYVALYAWHGKHHYAHIAGLRERMGWR